MIATAALAAVLAVGPATAHDASFPSSVTIHFYDAANPNSGTSQCDDPTELKDCFYGDVESALAGCTRHRTVKVFDRTPTSPMKVAAGEGTAPVLVGKTKSGSDGSWILLVDNPGTHTFFARVAERTITRTGHTHTCRRAISQDLTVTSDFG